MAADAIGASVGAVGGLVGGILTNSSNEKIAREATAANMASARQQMQFQEYMSNTSRQRDMTDLKTAGLNPLFAAGINASTPSGASGSAVTSTNVNALGEGLSSAKEALALSTEMKKAEAGVALDRAVKDKTVADEKTSVQNAKQSKAQTEKLETENRLLKKGVPRADAQGELEGKIYNKLNQFFDSYSTTGREKYEKAQKENEDYEKKYLKNLR